MIYFAADNNLDAEAFSDLEAIKKVGSTNDVNIVAQLDSQVRTDFISWSLDNFEAENTLLVLWGHGYGWERIDHTNRIAALSTDFVIYKDIASNE